MPQLMPLNWIYSMFMVIFILMMMMIMYSLIYYKMFYKSNNIRNYQMNWWW